VVDIIDISINAKVIICVVRVIAIYLNLSYNFSESNTFCIVIMIKLMYLL